MFLIKLLLNFNNVVKQWFIKTLKIYKYTGILYKYTCTVYIYSILFFFFSLSVTDGNLRHSTRSFGSYYSAEIELNLLSYCY